MRKNRIIAIVAAIGIIAAIAGVGYAFWSVQQKVTDNAIGTGSMSISLDNGAGQAAAAIDISGLMPGYCTDGVTNFAGTGVLSPAQYRITSAAGNPNVDLSFKVDNVASTKSLKDNVRLAFLLCTGGNAYWLQPGNTTVQFTAGEDSGYMWVSHAFKASDYNGNIWNARTLGLTGYSDLPAGAARDIKVYYDLPLDCANDCHSDTLNFDMTFELEQHHG